MKKKPVELHFEDIEINDEIKFHVKITEKMLDDFAELSGDYNPIHTNQEYASKTDFGKKICHGMLLASFFSRLIGMYIPGKNALYFSQSLNFRKPCFVNDKITIIGIVIEKKSSTKMIKLKTVIKNLKDEIIVDGEAKVLVRN